MYFTFYWKSEKIVGPNRRKHEMKMVEIMILTFKGFLFYYRFQVSKRTLSVWWCTNEVFQFLMFPGLGCHMPHYKAMIRSFLSFLGLKDFLNLTRMSWTILSWSYAITWFGNTRMPLKKQEGQITVLPDFLRYSSTHLQFCASLHDLGWELPYVLIYLW